jgi:hypothetical protein
MVCGIDAGFLLIRDLIERREHQKQLKAQEGEINVFLPLAL